MKDNVAELSQEYYPLWDGKDDCGSVVDDGTYSFKITGTDTNNNNAEEAVISVKVANKFLNITPTNQSPVNGIVDLAVSAGECVSSIPSSVEIEFYCRAVGNTSWTYVTKETQNNSAYIFNWDTTSLVNRDYELKFYVPAYYDADNNFHSSESASEYIFIVNN